jgi:hypothetical protein
VGVTIGTAVTNLLSPSDLAEFLRAERITHVRLYDADPRLLSALASSGATAIVGVPNDELLALGSSPATASAWVARLVLPFGISSNTLRAPQPISTPGAAPLILPTFLFTGEYRELAAADELATSEELVPTSAPPTSTYFGCCCLGVEVGSSDEPEESAWSTREDCGRLAPRRRVRYAAIVAADMTRTSTTAAATAISNGVDRPRKDFLLAEAPATSTEAAGGGPASSIGAVVGGPV